MPLPPRVPELGTVERVWQTVKQRELANRVFEG